MDTTCSQCVNPASALPFLDLSACNYGSVLCGVEMDYVLRPVHQVHVKSPLITGVYPVAVCPELPTEGISFLMGNDIAGNKVTPALEVVDLPQHLQPDKIQQTNIDLFPACVTPHAKPKRDRADEVPLSDSVLLPVF